MLTSWSYSALFLLLVVFKLNPLVSISIPARSIVDITLPNTLKTISAHAFERCEDINEIISKRYINERGLFHFIFLTTSTDAFLNFEEKFYKSNIAEEDEKKIMFGLMEKKEEKELNFDSKIITKKQMFKLKEYDNLRKILKSLKKQNYPYIGFVYGGFDLIHKKSLEYDS